MRIGVLLVSLLLLTRCGTVTDYNPDKNYSASSLQGSQGGGGVQTSIWSNDPDKRTITNQNPQ